MTTVVSAAVSLRHGSETRPMQARPSRPSFSSASRQAVMVAASSADAGDIAANIAATASTTLKDPAAIRMPGRVGARC